MVYQEKLAEFVAHYGEEAVIEALNAYATHRYRSDYYSAKAKKKRSSLKKRAKKAEADPQTQAKLAELGITL